MLRKIGRTDWRREIFFRKILAEDLNWEHPAVRSELADRSLPINGDFSPIRHRVGRNAARDKNQRQDCGTVAAAGY
jgi:hypothetical protein